MDSKRFDELVEERCRKIKSVLANKATEYARGDRLSNFKKTAGMRAQTPEKALRGMWDKHVISIGDLIDDIDEGRCNYKLFDEKITDTINYMILLEGLIEDRLIEIYKQQEAAKLKMKKK